MKPVPNRSYRSPNFNDRRNGLCVDLLVLHYTGMQSAEMALERLCDPKAEVSAHYLIDEAGSLFALVDEDKRAWHAGVSYWRGETDINSRSVGIELVNPGHEFGYKPFGEPQMRTLEALAKDIVARHAIKPANVIGHSDIAPLRKLDPGELFDWKRLADQGVGLYPETEVVKTALNMPFRNLLGIYGYKVDTDEEFIAATNAFKRHFWPQGLKQTNDDPCKSKLLSLIEQAELHSAGERKADGLTA